MFQRNLQRFPIPLQPHQKIDQDLRRPVTRRLRFHDFLSKVSDVLVDIDSQQERLHEVIVVHEGVLKRRPARELEVGGQPLPVLAEVMKLPQRFGVGDFRRILQHRNQVRRIDIRAVLAKQPVAALDQARNAG